MTRYHVPIQANNSADAPQTDRGIAAAGRLRACRSATRLASMRPSSSALAHSAQAVRCSIGARMATRFRSLGQRFLAIGVLVGACAAAAAPTAVAARIYWPDAASEISERPTLIKLGFEPNPDPEFGPTFVMIGTGYVSAGFPAISWSSWGGEAASGTGLARLGGQNSNGPIESQSEPVNAQVELSGRTACGGADIYTSLAVNLAPGSAMPSDWSFARAAGGAHRTCWPVDGCPEGQSTCTLVEDTVSDHPYRGTLRGKQIIEAEPFGPRHWLYRMHFHDWGSPITVGDGLLVSPDSMTGCASGAAACESARVYSARYTLADPRWCVARAFSGPHGSVGVSTGLNYTSATVEVFGNGAPLRGSSLSVPGPSYERLMVQIGAPGARRYVARSTLLRPPNLPGSPIKTSCLPG